MAKELLKIAVSDNMPAYVKLDAIKDALDRGGVSAKNAVEVEVGPSKAWEQVFAGVAGGSRADSRAARGITDGADTHPDNAIEDNYAAHRAMMERDQAARALDVPADDYLDAEVVPESEQPTAIDRTPASAGWPANGPQDVSPTRFVQEANAKAVNTRPRHV